MSVKKQVDRYNSFISEIGLGASALVNFKDKKKTVEFYETQMLNKTSSMFKYKGIPDTIPERYLELYIQSKGVCAIAKCPTDGNYYALLGGLGGECDAYYVPKYFIGANPWLNWDYELEQNVDCVVFFNDPLRVGLLPIIDRYATLLAENELTMNVAVINNRLTNIISTYNDRQFKAGQSLVECVNNGELAVFRDNTFMPTDIKPYGSSNQRYVTQLIELEQYLKAQLYNDLGLNFNYNMKRETLTSSEVMMNNDSLLPLVDKMLLMRKEAIEKCNNLFGWEASVEFNSSWFIREQENQLSLEKDKADISNAKVQQFNDKEMKKDEINRSDTELVRERNI